MQIPPLLVARLFLAAVLETRSVPVPVQLSGRPCQRVASQRPADGPSPQYGPEPLPAGVTGRQDPLSCRGPSSCLCDVSGRRCRAAPDLRSGAVGRGRRGGPLCCGGAAPATAGLAWRQAAARAGSTQLARPEGAAGGGCPPSVTRRVAGARPSHGRLVVQRAAVAGGRPVRAAVLAAR